MAGLKSDVASILSVWRMPLRELERERERERESGRGDGEVTGLCEMEMHTNAGQLFGFALVFAQANSDPASGAEGKEDSNIK